LLIATVAVILGSALLWAPSAMAHAVVEAIVPADGARLAQSPPEVRITFSETVQLLRGNDAEVVTATGESMTSGAAQGPAGNGQQVVIPLQPRLASGTYTARWRVVSADGDIIA
jgi:copper transport protein